MRFPFIAWAAALAACAGGASRSPFQEPAAGPPSGAYEYVANLPGHRVEGTIAILRDTIILEPSEGQCKPVMGTPSTTSISYECFAVGRYDRVVFTVDRQNAVQRSRWTATERVLRRREVCAAYAMQAGRRVCVRTKEETYEENLRHSGSMQLRPRSG